MFRRKVPWGTAGNIKGPGKINLKITTNQVDGKL